MNESKNFDVMQTVFTSLIDSRDSAHPSVTQLSSSQHLCTNIRSGSALPGYRDRIRKGLDASTAYTRSGLLSADRTMSVIEARYRDPDPSFGYTLDINARHNLACGFTEFPSPHETEVRNRALQNIKNQLSSRMGSSKLMAPLAECRELRGLVHQAVFFSTNFARAVLTAKRTRGKYVRKVVSDLWLGYNFGLAPMMKDISSAGQSIAAYLARQDEALRLSGSASDTGFTSVTPFVNPQATPFGFGIKTDAHVTYTVSYRYIGAFDVRLLSSNDYSMLSHLGLSYTSVPAAAWELMGFSWLWDYFFNIGQFLEDAFVQPPGQTKYLVECRKYEALYTTNFSFYPLDAYKSRMAQYVNVPGKSVLEYQSFTRKPLTNLPHISLCIKSMDTVGKYGLSKLLNLLAILGK